MLPCIPKKQVTWFSTYLKNILAHYASTYSGSQHQVCGHPYLGQLDAWINLVVQQPDIQEFSRENLINSFAGKKIYGYGYYIEQGAVFYEDKKIPHIDADTFEVVCGPYARDQKSIFLFGKKFKNILHADPGDIKLQHLGVLIVLCWPLAKKLQNSFLKNWPDLARREPHICSYLSRYLEELVFYASHSIANKKYVDDLLQQCYEGYNWYAIRDRNLQADRKYILDQGNLFFQQYTGDIKKLIRGVDLDTFELIGGEYSRDQNHVYYQGEVVSDADPKSAQYLQDAYLKDAKGIYISGHMTQCPADLIEKIDVNSFEVLSGKYAKDTHRVYFIGAPVSGWKIVDGADPFTFQEKIVHYAVDAKHVFYSEKTIPEANPTTFAIHERYATDDKAFFIGPARISYEDVDVSSFKIPNYYCQGYYDVIAFVTDKNHVYSLNSNGTQYVCAPNIDTASFRVVSVHRARDKSHTYSWVFGSGVLIDQWNGNSVPADEEAAQDMLIHKNGKIYVKLFEKLAPLPFADMNTFQRIGGHNSAYWKDARSVWFANLRIPTADLGTFHEVAGSPQYYVDKDAVYMGSSVLQGVSPHGYQRLSEIYFKDNKHVYALLQGDSGEPLGIFILQDADLASFQITSENRFYAKDATHVYYHGVCLLGVDPATFGHIYGNFYGDVQHVFLGSQLIPGLSGKDCVKYDLGGICMIADASNIYEAVRRGNAIQIYQFAKDELESAIRSKGHEVIFDPSIRRYAKLFFEYQDTFSTWSRQQIAISRPVGERSYSMKGKDVFFYTKKIMQANAQTFACMSWYGDCSYTCDVKSVFFLGKKIPQADAHHFSLLRHDGKLYGKDEYHVYLDGKIVKNAHPDTYQDVIPLITIPSSI